VIRSIGPEGVVHHAQLRHELHHRVVEPEQAAVAQLHYGDAGERLRDRRPVKDCVLVHSALRREIGEAVELAREQLTAAHEPERTSHHALLVERAVVARRDLAQGRVEADRLLGACGVRNAGDEDGGKNHGKAGVRRARKADERSTSHDHGISLEDLEHESSAGAAPALSAAAPGCGAADGAAPTFQ